MHPGEMGAAIGKLLVDRGHDVFWRPRGRGPETARRARESGIEPTDNLSTMEVIVSVCPPDAALDVARELRGYGALVIDANAISPAKAQEIGALLGGRWVDGGIVGPPPRRKGTTRLFLSGDLAGDAALLFEGTPLETVVLDGSPVAASALKMAYAAWSKGAAALLLCAYASARAEGLDQALLAEWRRSRPDLPERLDAAVADAAEKGWRWEGEMWEIVATLEAQGLPTGFHAAAAEVFSLPPPQG